MPSIRGSAGRLFPSQRRNVVFGTPDAAQILGGRAAEERLSAALRGGRLLDDTASVASAIAIRLIDTNEDADELVTFEALEKALRASNDLLANETQPLS